ncbi:hypothetical protein CRG98_011968 [Punica granatum]|uniref:Uncharacterized protein n=1 Tax=Punica granatum TaxID=22663 RepID=A0A2I0KGX2_PUNGR|nr:hypothetical protein CRG98_011968 [Punica granatum]
MARLESSALRKPKPPDALGWHRAAQLFGVKGPVHTGAEIWVQKTPKSTVSSLSTRRPIRNSGFIGNQFFRMKTFDVREPVGDGGTRSKNKVDGSNGGGGRGRNGGGSGGDTAIGGGHKNKSRWKRWFCSWKVQMIMRVDP